MLVDQKREHCAAMLPFLQIDWPANDEERVVLADLHTARCDRIFQNF